MSSPDVSRSSGRTSPVGAASSPPGAGSGSTFLRPSDALSPATHATMLSSRRWPADEPRPVNLVATPTKRHDAVKIDASRRSELVGLDMSGFKIKSLTPNLARFTFLTELRLANNFITRLPPGIGLLRAVAFLDLSNNYLAELPPEVGWMSCLKELLLFNNHLEDLPGEMGYLYQLENLGIDGNPLNDNLVQVIQTQGSLAIIPFLRDNMISSVPPAERVWHNVETYAAAKYSVTVACYNILCDKYATPQMFGYVPTWFLNWDYRKQMIIHELLSYDADIVCLQEVEANQFETYFKPQLRMRGGYEGVFSPKSRARTMSEWDRNYVDGCATFFKADRFKMEEKVLVEFNQMALSRPSLRKHKDMYNRVMTRDNIALVLRLNHKESRQEIIIGNVHIHWDPSFRDVKIVQTIMLVEELEKMMAQHARSALIVCGDFNSLPGSAVCSFLEEGSIPPNHPDFMGHTYEPYTSEGALSSLNLRNAYSIAPDASPFTSFTPMFLGAIDYIWYRPVGLAVAGCLGTIPLEYTKQVVGLPSQHLPSDHVSLLAEFRLEGGGSGKKEVGAGNTGVRYSTSNPDLAGSGSRRLFSRNKNAMT